MKRIATKAEMYALLAAGRLGNTIPQWFDVASWEASADFRRFPVWGVRTLIPGGPCRLFCPRDEVRATAERPEFAAAGVNISMMIDVACTITLWCEVQELPSGLMAYGIEYPPKGFSWRQLMPTQGRTWEKTAARMLLRKHLSPDSLDDLEVLLSQYPGHVVEFSACEEQVGTIPGRNGVIWEVRSY